MSRAFAHLKWRNERKTFYVMFCALALYLLAKTIQTVSLYSLNCNNISFELCGRWLRTKKKINKFDNNEYNGQNGERKRYNAVKMFFAKKKKKRRMNFLRWWLSVQMVLKPHVRQAVKNDFAQSAQFSFGSIRKKEISCLISSFEIISIFLWRFFFFLSCFLSDEHNSITVTSTNYKRAWNND